LKESKKCPLARSHSRKEFTKMTKFTTESKNSEEGNKKSNKDGFSNNIKEKTRNQVLQKIKTKMFGMKSSLNKNQPKSLSQKNHQIQTNLHQAK
jgi:hypothetical protein